MSTELQDFKSRATEKAADVQHRDIIARAIRTYDEMVTRGKRQFIPKAWGTSGTCAWMNFPG